MTIHFVIDLHKHLVLPAAKRSVCESTNEPFDGQTNEISKQFINKPTELTMSN